MTLSILTLWLLLIFLMFLQAMSSLLKSRTYFSTDLSLFPWFRLIGMVGEVMPTFHGRLITPFLLCQIHVCSSERSDMSFVYRFMRGYVDHRLLIAFNRVH